MEITLTLNRKDVIGEVMQTVEYAGAKMINDPTAYKRMSLQEEDEPALKHFWDACREEIVWTLRRAVVRDEMVGEEYELVLAVNDGFNYALVPVIGSAMYSYFVNNMVSRWNVYTNKGEVEMYARLAQEHLDRVVGSVFYRKEPIVRAKSPM